MTPLARLVWVGLALGLTACATGEVQVARVDRGPTAQDIFVARSYLAMGRGPNFDEQRFFDDRLDDRIARYLREHPEVQTSVRYSEIRFWRQVGVENTADEVRVLLGEPLQILTERPAIEAVAKQQWSAVEKRVREAWVYPAAWVIYLDDKDTVFAITRPQGGPGSP